MGVGPDGIAVGGVDPATQGVPGSDGGDEQVTETVTVETSSVPPHHHIVHHHQSGIQDPATGGKIIFIVVLQIPKSCPLKFLSKFRDFGDLKTEIANFRNW